MSDQPMMGLAQVAAEIAAAARTLAMHRLGAIILWDPAVSVQGGVVLDAAVSRQLLVAIFAPESRLGTGAVILRDGRIERAAVALAWATVVERAAELAAGVAIGVDEDRGEVRIVTRSGHAEVVGLERLADALRRQG